MEEVQSRQTSTRPTTAGDATSGSDAQRSLMTDTRTVTEYQNLQDKQPDFLTTTNFERQERKREEKRQKILGYGHKHRQNIIDANKRDSDREAQKQTGDPNEAKQIDMEIQLEKR